MSAAPPIGNTDSTSSLGPGPPGDPGNNNDDYYANFGEAVKVLREDLPLLFSRDLRYHIYREDITFRTPSLQYFTGLWKYKLLNRTARWLGRILYSDASVNTLRMWQPAGNNRQLRVRWSVQARPRLSFSVEDDPFVAEAISTYTFDSKGRIFEHQVDRIIPPESPLAKLIGWVVERLQNQGAVVAPEELPIPGVRGLRHALAARAGTSSGSSEDGSWQ